MRLLVACLLLLSLGASPPIVIDGPARLDAGDMAQFTCRGLEPSAIGAARVIVWPRDKTTVIPAISWGGEPFVLFQSKTNGTYLIAVAVNNPGGDTILYGEKVVVVGTGPAPPPGPDPPVPPPNPTDLRAAAKAKAAECATALTAEAKRDAANIAAVYRHVAERKELTTPGQLVQITRGMREQVMNPAASNRQAWQRWAECVGAWIPAGKSCDEYREVWRGIGDALSEVQR